jgi:hypothetical protein
MDLGCAAVHGRHEGSHGDGDDGDAVPASARSNGNGAVSARRIASKRQPDEPASAATPALRGITTLAVLAVALVAAVASYDHQRALAELAGEGWQAWLLRCRLTVWLSQRRCPCWCDAEQACRRECLPGQPCLQVSAPALPPTSLQLTPRPVGRSIHDYNIVPLRSGRYVAVSGPTRPAPGPLAELNTGSHAETAWARTTMTDRPRWRWSSAPRGAGLPGRCLDRVAGLAAGVTRGRGSCC